MNITQIRRHCQFGLVIAHRHADKVWLEVTESQSSNGLYYWDENDSGYPGCVQHSGNFLRGTERRGPVIGGGDWVQYPHIEYSYVVTTRSLGFGANGYPSLRDVEDAFDGKRTKNWEYRHPGDGTENAGKWFPLSGRTA